MLVKTSELSGTALDWAVCKANGEHQHPYDEYTPTWMANRRYSEDWAKGGPIIEREGISLKYEADPYRKWTATWRKIEYKVVRHHTKIVKGPKVEMSAPLGSPLVAAMRCFVASKLGEEVEVPEEVCDESL